MKSLIIAVLAVLGLAGCVAVPYYAAPGPDSYYYGAPAVPASVYFRYDHRHHHYNRYRR